MAGGLCSRPANRSDATRPREISSTSGLPAPVSGRPGRCASVPMSARPTRLAEAAARGARPRPDLLRRPAGLEGARGRYAGGAALRAAAGRRLDLYVHAPYSSTSPRPTTGSGSRAARSSTSTRRRPPRSGAKGLIVHGGHVTKADDPAVGIDNWAKTFERMTPPAAGADREHRGRRLRDGPAPRRARPAVGRDRAGRRAVRLLPRHLPRARRRRGAARRRRPGQGDHRPDRPGARNDSRDEFDSGADRHANFGDGQIDPDGLVAVVPAAGAPVVCETPGGAEGQGADIAWLRERLPA